MAASVVFLIALFFLGQAVEGLKCYCEGRHCKGDDEKGTCIEEPGGVCFGALAKVYYDDPNQWKYEFFYGCYTGGPEKLAMCQRNEIPGMKCCQDRDYCNWYIMPRLPDHMTTPGPEEEDNDILHPAVVYVCVSVSALLILICALAIYCFLKRRRERNVRTDEGLAIAMSDLTTVNAD